MSVGSIFWCGFYVLDPDGSLWKPAGSTSLLHLAPESTQEPGTHLPKTSSTMLQGLCIIPLYPAARSAICHHFNNESRIKIIQRPHLRRKGRPTRHNQWGSVLPALLQWQCPLSWEGKGIQSLCFPQGLCQHKPACLHYMPVAPGFWGWRCE